MRELHPAASRLRRSRSRRPHSLRNRLETYGQRPKRIQEMTRRTSMTKKLWLATALITPLAAFGQAASTASIHGHAQDPSGVPMANAQIQISTDGKTALYTFNADQ